MHLEVTCHRCSDHGHGAPWRLCGVRSVQIAQYHPVWRVYAYRLEMPRSEFIQFFESQGLKLDTHKNVMLFPGAAPKDAEFIDGLIGDPISGFRVWRRP
jgi:hypothetical protein